MQHKDMPSQIKNTRHVSQTKQSIRRPINVHSELLATATHESKTQRHVSHTKQSTRPPPKFLSSFSSWLTTQHETHVLCTNQLFLFSLKDTRETSRAHMSRNRNNRHAPKTSLPSWLTTQHETHVLHKSIVLLLIETHKTDFPHANQSTHRHIHHTNNKSHATHQCALRNDTEP